ncbi:hypothetical protein, partial [Desulfurella sp.]|uniref:hypothetical protein n=1 Tax=Desulfurella sp. TaxID=1962857 RepID=UPI0025BCCE18
LIIPEGKDIIKSGIILYIKSNVLNDIVIPRYSINIPATRARKSPYESPRSIEAIDIITKYPL